MKSIRQQIIHGLSNDGPGHVLVLGDCLDILEHVPSNTVQAFITSPPYDTRRKATYGGVHEAGYLEWLLPRIRLMVMALTPTGVLVCNISPGRKSDGSLSIYDMQLVSTLVVEDGLAFAQKLNWLKGNFSKFVKNNTLMGGAGTGSVHRDCCEPIYVFARNMKFYRDINAVKNPIGDWASTRVNGKSGRVNSSTGSGFGCDRVKAAENEFARPHNVVRDDFDECENGIIVTPTATNGGENNTYKHSAVFPTTIPAHFIAYATRAMDVVCDPFVGSGTTMYTAFRDGRRSIGIDSSPDSIEKAKQRLNDNNVPYLFIDASKVLA